MKILIVEDDYLCREVMRRYMENYGTCNIVVNGQEAIDAFKQSLIDQSPYDLICLDIMMPEVSGQDALKGIRQAETDVGIEGLSRTKIIMTTALADVDSVMTAFRSDCDGYLVKPVTRDAIVKLFQQLKLVE